jgi:ankyrin repeat protein
MTVEIRESVSATSEDVLSGIESRLGFCLPAEYRAFLLRHNGGIPRPEWFRVRLKDEWMAARRSHGRLHGFGQKHGNSALREQWKDWHRAIRFIPVGQARNDAEPSEFEQLFRSRPEAMPRNLAPIAEVGSFELNGWLCLNLTADSSESGGVHFWPDVAVDGGTCPSAPVARSFNAFLEILRPLGDTPPPWLPLVQNGDLGEFQRWLDRNHARLREPDMWGWTSLDHAVFEGRSEIVHFLMEKRDVTPGMVFYDAMVDGRFSTARGMLRLGVDPELVEASLARKSDVFWADTDTVRDFLDAGANVEHIDNSVSNENTPLHFAARAGSLDAVRLLLARGADPGVENGDGKLPRDCAVDSGHPLIAELLQEAAAARPTRTPDSDRFAREPEDVQLESVEIRDAANGLDEATIQKLERRLQVRLPGEYRAFLKKFHGGRPNPARFRLREGAVCEISQFLVVGDGETPFGETPDVESARASCQDWGLTRRYLPFADAANEFTGGYLCISLRGKDRGRIVYYPQSDGGDSQTYSVAKTLSGLFSLLSKAKRKKVPDWVNAIESGDLDALQRWLGETGTSALKTKHRGRTPLEIAIDRGRTDIVRWLLERGASAQAAFELATEAGQANVMLDLLHRDDVRKGISRSILSSFGPAAPVFWRNSALIRELVDLGADVNGRSAAGLTPLMLAAQDATPETLRFLMERGARTCEWSHQGELALHRAACANPRAEMLQKMRILIDAGESLHARAPLTVLPDHAQKTLQAMETPIADLLKQGGPFAAMLKGLLGSLGQDAPGVPVNLPSTPSRNPYREQFQRTAADFLTEIRKDPDALTELEAYATRNQTEDTGA